MRTLTLRCEHVIRNYDPCISCSVHFLRLERLEAEAMERQALEKRFAEAERERG